MRARYFMNGENAYPLRVLIYAQHLSGVGHYVRSFEIARELAKYHEVYWVEGGKSVPRMPCSRLHRITLPSLTRGADGKISALTAQENTETILALRSRILNEEVQRIRPHAMIVEYFPFSKWELATELMPAITAASRGGARVFCSLRDVVKKTRFETGSEQDYSSTVCKTLNSHFDALLVHSDPDFTRLDEHFANLREIDCPIYYTGLVSERPMHSAQTLADIERISEGKSVVLLSSGGGIGGMRLVEQVVATWRLADIVEKRMLVICAALDWPESWSNRLQQSCRGLNIRLLPFRDDFLQWMQAAELSISQAGYNTATNILETRVRALVVPNPEMSDQPFRARRLEEMGLVERLSPEQLNPDSLAVAIKNALARARPNHNINMAGAHETRVLIETLLSGRSPV